MGEQLEVIKYFEQGSSQSEESDDEVDEGGDDAVTALASHDAAIAADAVNAAADAAINSTAAPGPATVAQKDLVGASPGEGTGGMWGRAETLTVAEATEARVDAASAAATAAEELLLGKGLLADNITDSQYRTSRIVLLDRGTAIKPLGM